MEVRKALNEHLDGRVNLHGTHTVRKLANFVGSPSTAKHTCVKRIWSMALAATLIDLSMRINSGSRISAPTHAEARHQVRRIQGRWTRSTLSLATSGEKQQDKQSLGAFPSWRASVHLSRQKTGEMVGWQKLHKLEASPIAPQRYQGAGPFSSGSTARAG